jgi:hypothetical protein
MLTETKNDLTYEARKLVRPYESYSIDELADAYCDAVDSGNETLKSIYISALILRFWHKIDKMYRANTVAPSLEYEDFFWWLYEAIEYACKYRGWRDTEKNLNAQQCINKCIDTIKLQKYYNLRLDKNKTINHCTSMDTPMYGDDESVRTLGDTIECEEAYDELNGTDAMMLIQSYINKNKIIEAILLDNIAFNDVQRYFKKTVKTKNSYGETIRYTEHSSEFWPYRLIQIVSKLPDSYKASFMKRYNISEEKLTVCLEVIEKSTNQKLYRYLRKCLADLKESYAV